MNGVTTFVKKILKKKDEFSSSQETEEMNTGYLLLFSFMTVALMLLFLYIGSVLWNRVLVKSVSGVKQVTYMQFIGIYLLLAILIPTGSF